MINNGPLYEREAEMAYARMADIERAAAWCREQHPHKLQFLADMRRILMAEERHLTVAGFPDAVRRGVVRRAAVLTLLTPSQALRLLECHLRATTADQRVWRAKTVEDLDRIAADARRRLVVNEVKAALSERAASARKR